MEKCVWVRPKEFVAKALVDAAGSSFWKWTENRHLRHSRVVGLHAGPVQGGESAIRPVLIPLKMSNRQCQSADNRHPITTTTGGTMGRADFMSSRLTNAK